MKPRSFLATLSLVGALGLIVPLGSARAQVTILTVGPDGTYGTIQAAIDAAVVGDDTEIRVEAGTYVENTSVFADFSAGSLALLGGWDASFTVRNDFPGNTTIDGNSSGPVLVLNLGDVSFLIDGFTLTNGLHLQGGGISIFESSSGWITVSNCHIVGNTASATGFPAGGGLRAGLIGSQQLDVVGCLIADNEAINTAGGQATGGGITISAAGAARFSMQHCDIEGNSIESDGGLRRGAGLFLFLGESAQGEVIDTVIFDNEGLGSGTELRGSGGYIDTQGAASLNLEQTAWAANRVTAGGSGPQLDIRSDETSTMRISDSGIAQGDAGGLRASSDGTSTLHLVNLTVADHPAVGLHVQLNGIGILSLYNSISFDNGTDLSTQGTVDTGSNLIGIDPLFLDADRFDYHLRIGSPAENAGDNAPPGDLGLFDFDGNPRIKDGTVDIGFMEGIAEIFTDGFESGDTTAWSTSTP